MKRTRDDDPSNFLHQSYDDEEEDEDEDSSSVGFQPQQSPPQPQQVKHFCVICSKQFSSGKAYGGHVRIHSSEYGSNKGKTKKMKAKKKRKIGLVNNKEKEKEKEIDLIRADDDEREIIRCCLCGKEFQTMHSLFGHMRRHPDRSWKGIRPPIPEKLNLSFLDDDDDDDDENDEDYDEVMSGVTKDVRDAACCLMMLKTGKRKAAMETANSEVRSFSYCNDEMDVDMKIKMENDVMNVNNPQDEAKKRSLEIDLNQPYDSY